jgi:hypothetical protein
MKGSGKLKLPERVMEIKRLFATTDFSDSEIAEMYGVSRPHINAIRNGKHYKDIPNEIKGFTTTHTMIGGYDYSSGISVVETNYGMKYLIIHYINDEVFHECGSLYDEQPNYDTFREKHDLFIKRFVRL